MSITVLNPLGDNPSIGDRLDEETFQLELDRTAHVTEPYYARTGRGQSGLIVYVKEMETYKLPAAPHITKSILPNSVLVFDTAASSSAGFLTSAEAGIHRLPVDFDNLLADSSSPFALNRESTLPPPHP